MTVLAPMKATAATLATAGPYLRDGWSAEIKIDGCRATWTIGATRSWLANDRTGDRSQVAPALTGVHAEVAPGPAAAVLRRRDHSAKDARRLAGVLCRLDGTVLDGEFHAPAGPGETLPPFSRSSGWFNSGRARARMLTIAYGPARFAVFDVLRSGGQDWTRRPYAERRAELERITEAIGALYPDCGLWLVPRLPATAEVVDAVLDAGFEGVVLKRDDSIVVPGTRSAAWIKIKAVATVDVVLTGGWEPGENGRAGTVGSVEIALAGPAGTLVPCGHCAVKPQLTTVITPSTAPALDGVVWEVEANGVTAPDGDAAYGKLRHPRYLRARPDKNAAGCGPGQLKGLNRA